MQTISSSAEILGPQVQQNPYGDAFRDVDMDDFLAMMIAELQNQDPLNPMDNTQMIAQLAQFASLEQMTNLNESFESLSSPIARLSFVSAGALLGKTVTATDQDGGLIEGAVDSVSLDSGTVYVTVEGVRVPMGNIQSVT